MKTDGNTNEFSRTGVPAIGPVLVLCKVSCCSCASLHDVACHNIQKETMNRAARPPINIKEEKMQAQMEKLFIKQETSRKTNGMITTSKHQD